MMKKSSVFVVLIIIIALCFGGCGDDSNDKGNRTFDEQSIKPYENLIAATDAKVVESLGEGDAQENSDDTEEKEGIYSVMWQRGYKGCLFSETGITKVSYTFPDYADMISGDYKDDPRKVSYIVMQAVLPPAEAIEINAKLNEMYGAPSGEEAPFNKDQYYNGYWEKEKLIYLFTYDPNKDTHKGNCGVTFAIQDKGVLAKPTKNESESMNS